MKTCEIRLNEVPTPRGRSKSEEKREQILEAASDLFLSQGFDNVSMIAVADSANVSKQTVYSHFGSKDELFSAAIEMKCQKFQLLDILDDLENPITDTLMVIAHQFDALINSFEGIRIYSVCIANSLNVESDNRISELFWQAGPEKVKQALCQYFTEQIARGKLMIEQPEFASQQFLYMLKSEDNMRHALGLNVATSAEQRDAYLHSCVELFCKAYDIQ